MSIMGGVGTRTKQIFTSPYPIEKSGSPHTHIYIQSRCGFSITTRMCSGNIHRNIFICHL